MSNIIDQLELSVRTTNVLKLMGDVHTLDDFMGLTKNQVCSIRGAGQRTWNEIRQLQLNLFQRAEEAAEKLKPSFDRDEIALHVLPQIIESCKNDTLAAGESRGHMFARKAYAMADEMLLARNR